MVLGCYEGRLNVLGCYNVVLGRSHSLDAVQKITAAHFVFVAFSLQFECRGLNLSAIAAKSRLREASTLHLLPALERRPRVEPPLARTGNN